MLGLLDESPSSAIRDWEAAGNSFGLAVNKYLDLTQTLAANAFNDGISPNHLVARIDCAMKSLHLVVNHQFALAQSALAQTRNRIMSPIFRLPEEVLGSIFTHAVFKPFDPENPLPMSTSLVNIYRSLHNLLGVCSAWRNTLLAAGRFWSVVPIFDRDSSPLAFTFENATSLSLDRAGDRDLCLAAVRGREWGFTMVPLEDIPRFRSVNISAKSRVVISNMLESFLRLIPDIRLSELSIKVEREKSLQTELPDDMSHLFPRDDRYRDSFDVLLSSLSVLRICSIPVYWDQAAFSDRLVELHLQEIIMGYDMSMIHLLNALSGATKLRDLKLTAVQTFQDPTAEVAPQADIVLPSLRSLVIQDLYSNTLAIVLRAISSRSHRLTLHLTRKCTETIKPGETEPDEADFDDLRNLLGGVSVHELLINAESETLVLWLSPAELGMLMESVPEVETLKLKSWLFNENYCNALRHPRNASSGLQERTFPNLKNLHLSWVRVEDQEAFRTMVSSHAQGLEWMVLGALIRKRWPGGSVDWDDLEEDDDLGSWALRNVPNLLLDNPLDPLDFELPEWQLW